MNSCGSAVRHNTACFGCLDLIYVTCQVCRERRRKSIIGALAFCLQSRKKFNRHPWIAASLYCADKTDTQGEHLEWQEVDGFIGRGTGNFIGSRSVVSITNLLPGVRFFWWINVTGNRFKKEMRRWSLGGACYLPRLQIGVLEKHAKKKQIILEFWRRTERKWGELETICSFSCYDYLTTHPPPLSDIHYSMVHLNQ